eukprot:4341501-Prymnesium_polylepis.1
MCIRDSCPRAALALPSRCPRAALALTHASLCPRSAHSLSRTHARLALPVTRHRTHTHARARQFPPHIWPTATATPHSEPLRFVRRACYARRGAAGA